MDTKPKTNAEVIDDIAKRKTVMQADGTTLTHFHLGHLDPEDLSKEADIAPRHIVDWSCGTAIWGHTTPTAMRRPIEDLSDHPDY